VDASESEQRAERLSEALRQHQADERYARATAGDFDWGHFKLAAERVGYQKVEGDIYDRTAFDAYLRSAEQSRADQQERTTKTTKPTRPRIQRSGRKTWQSSDTAPRNHPARC
jgi:hypothetical protein